MLASWLASWKCSKLLLAFFRIGFIGFWSSLIGASSSFDECECLSIECVVFLVVDGKQTSNEWRFRIGCLIGGWSNDFDSLDDVLSMDLGVSQCEPADRLTMIGLISLFWSIESASTIKIKSSFLSLSIIGDIFTGESFVWIQIDAEMIVVVCVYVQDDVWWWSMNHLIENFINRARSGLWEVD